LTVALPLAMLSRMSIGRAQRTDAARWSRCPGCGLRLPDPDGEVDPRRNSSGACWALYGEVEGYELSYVAQLGNRHQLLVDTYGAQHVGPKTPAIGGTFCLIGLELALVEGWSGIAVRDAHQELARRFRTWPTFTPPARPADVTVFDLALATTPDEYETILVRWAAAVWATWEGAHQQARDLIEQRLRSKA
jgi:hypothetical protein